MGNGAAVGAGNRKLLLNFEYVENLARRGHFHKNVSDYKDAVEECIRSGEMDVLEILIPAGNAQGLSQCGNRFSLATRNPRAEGSGALGGGAGLSF